MKVDNIMFYDEEQQIRQEMKQRYNRRFFLLAHLGLLLFGLIIGGFIPSLSGISLFILLALIPHLLYAGYGEYQDWLSRKVDRELYRRDKARQSTEKRKRYQADAYGIGQYQLTDDGELEPIHQPKMKHNRLSDSYRDDKEYSDHKSRKSSKKRRKYDTDEFDVKKLFKKLKDIVD